VSGVLRFVYLLALAVWIGEVVFFSFVVAPSVFGVLGPERAGELVGAIFPRYYALGGAAAAIAVVSGIALARRSAYAGRWAAAVAALAVGLAAIAWAGAVVHPRAQRLRAAIHADGRAPGDDPLFQRAHRLAVTLNGVALVGGLVGLGLSAAALRQ
jgi:uncharacterized membrane protein